MRYGQHNNNRTGSSGNNKRKLPAERDNDERELNHYPSGFNSRFGGLALRYGVVVTEPAGFLAFGNTITALAEGVEHDPSEIKCIADLAPGDKDRWCPLGKDKCPRGGAKHVVPASLAPESSKLVRANMKDPSIASQIADCKWNVLISPSSNAPWVIASSGAVQRLKRGWGHR